MGERFPTWDGIESAGWGCCMFITSAWPWYVSVSLSEECQIAQASNNNRRPFESLGFCWLSAGQRCLGIRGGLSHRLVGAGSLLCGFNRRFELAGGRGLPRPCVLVPARGAIGNFGATLWRQQYYGFTEQQRLANSSRRSGALFPKG